MALDVLVTMGGADMLFERLSEDTLAAYERCYFEEVCKIPTGRRSTFSTPLPQIEGLHFACVQDTVERLIETEHGRLSTFQWRNFVFAPIDRNVSEKDVYERVFDELRRALPSIFIRSYVYLVFIEVKTRKDERFGRPALAVDRRKRQALCRGASAFIRRAHYPSLTYRFDIVEVYTKPLRIVHLPGAF